MEEIPILQDIVTILGASLVVLLLSHRLRIPTIVGFLITGAIIGPYGLGLIHSTEHVRELAEIGIILLLFTIGLEFSFGDLLRGRKAVLLGGALQVGLTAGAVWVMADVFGLTSKSALFAGFLLALSSTAIVLKTLQERAEIDSPHGRTVLSILIFQDIIIVPMIILTPMLAEGADAAAGSLPGLLGRGVIIVVLAYVLARWWVPKALYLVTRTQSREMFILAVAVIGIAVAWLTSQMGLSLGLGAFLAGLVISESEYSHQALEGVLPFRDLFNSFFFVSVGMLFNAALLWQQTLPIFGITLAVLAFKTIVAGGVGMLLGMSLRSALLVGLGLCQIGEFSFILANEGLSYGLIDSELYQSFIGISVLTMAATPFIIAGAPFMANLLIRMPLSDRLRRGLSQEAEVDTRAGGPPMGDHLVIVGFGVNGHNVARVARQANIRYRIVETNPDTVREARENAEPIEYGDATYPEVLRHVGADRARVLVIAISDPVATRRITKSARDLSPNLHIIVRTRFVKEVEPLRELGANEVIPEEFETSIEIFTRVLTRYLVARPTIERFIQDVRADSYDMLRTVSRAAPRVVDLAAGLPGAEITPLRVAPTARAINRSLGDLDLRGRYGVTVLAIRRGEEVMANPGAATILQGNDELFVLGSPSAVADVGKMIQDR